MAYEYTLSALADPTRRRLFEKLGRREHTVGALARSLRISQPAVSQHLRVLRKARLVAHRRDGTRRHYQASLDGLAELRRYIESFWDGVLTAFAAADPAPRNRRRASHAAAPPSRRSR